MKWALLLIGVILASAYFVSGLRINEINPYGNEYIEIYNDGGSVDLSSWKISDNSGQTDTVKCGDGCVTSEKYFLIVGGSADLSKFSGKVFLVDDQRIGNGLNDDGDKAGIETGGEKLSVEYGKISSGKSWNFCDGKLSEGEPTVNSENGCSVTEDATKYDKKDEEISLNDDSEDESLNEVKFITGNAVSENGHEKTISIESQTDETKEIIKLGAQNAEQQTIKTEVYESNISKISKYSVWVFVALSVGIFAVYIMRRIKYG